MALINCPECGCEISDSVEKCLGCGIELKYLKKCLNCGQYLLDSDKVCCNYGNRGLEFNSNVVSERLSVRNFINKKWIIGIIFIIVTIMAFLLMPSRLNQKDNGLFENYSWGTSYADLADILEKKNGKKTNGDGSSKLYDTIEDYNDMEGIEASVIYQFGRTGLSSVMVFLTFNSTDYTGDDIWKMMNEKFNKMYGDGEPLQSGMFTLEYQTNWTTENSIISLVNYSDDMVVIEYNPN